MDNGTIDTWQLLIGLLGGLALFLFGLEQLTSMLKATAGTRMRNILGQVTTNRFKAVLAGSFTTAIIQSSSVTTVLVVGFVSAGLMTLQQSIGIIMGASIGTTITAQVIAFKVTQYALIAVIIGFSMQFFSQNDRMQRYGMMVLGLGLVFYGMNMMGDATRPLRDYQPFIDLLTRMDDPLLNVLLSAAFTAVVQSSSATTGVIIVLGSQGLMSLEQGIALVLGANIGTCVTALLAAIGTQRQGLRPALIHIIFNVAGVVLWFGFIEQLAELSRWVSPTTTSLSGTAQLAADIPRQIANAHTIFNVGNTLVFIWFTGVFARLVTWLVPEQRPTGPGTIEPRFLSDTLIDTPALALDAARMEIVRMASYVMLMVEQAGPVVLAGSSEDLDRLQRLDEDVDILHASIVRYLGRISRRELVDAETLVLRRYLDIATLYESTGDMVETDLVKAGRTRLARGFQVSQETRAIINQLAEHVMGALQTTCEAVDKNDSALARQVIDKKNDIQQVADRISSRLINRLIAEDPHRTSAYRTESQLVENYKRIYYFTKRIARLISEADNDPEDETPVRGDEASS